MQGRPNYLDDPEFEVQLTRLVRVLERVLSRIVRQIVQEHATISSLLDQSFRPLLAVSVDLPRYRMTAMRTVADEAAGSGQTSLSVLLGHLYRLM